MSFSSCVWAWPDAKRKTLDDKAASPPALQIPTPPCVIFITFSARINEKHVNFTHGEIEKANRRKTDLRGWRRQGPKFDFRRAVC